MITIPTLLLPVYQSESDSTMALTHDAIVV